MPGLLVLAALFPSTALPQDAGTAPEQDPDRPLAIGLTESDPRLLATTGRLAPAARKAIALRPRFIRVLVSWERLQPRANRRPNWDAPDCPQLAPSCRSAHGLRGLLRAIKRRQLADGGWRIVVSPYFTPPWAVRRPPAGCQRAGTPVHAQMPRVSSYRMFLRSLQALGDKVGVQLRYWMPWNEPNHPGFINPQRRVCDPRAQALAPALYARLARAAAAELRPDQQLVLGGLAGLDSPRTYAAGASEFIRELPRDVACLDAPFAQNVYIGRKGRRGGLPPRADPAEASGRALLEDVKLALDSHGCETPKRLWITETGTFDHRCEAMAAALTDWANDDRIDAAFQYTFRESPAFPVGLLSLSLATTYRSYAAWRAFAGAVGTVPADPCG